MTKEEIAELVAALPQGMDADEFIYKLVNWAVDIEREACAKVCEEEASRAKWNWDNDISGNQPFWNGGEQLASSCAEAIRERGKK